MALKFGTSGVRGLVTEMTGLECYLYTKAFVKHLKSKTAPEAVSLAGDYRNSTPEIKKAVSLALQDEGLKVDNCGDIPTGALTLHGITCKRASIMVTGSHIPEDRNGIKFNMPWGEILKEDETSITKFYKELKNERLPDIFNENGGFKSGVSVDAGILNRDAEEAYICRYIDFFPHECLKGLKIVLYEHSAVGRDIFIKMFTQLGAEIIRAGRSDKFIPLDTEAVRDTESLSEWVLDNKADALISTDGDSDRPLLVDENGKVVRGDVLGIIVSDFLEADSVSTPVSCNTALEKCNRFKNISRTKIGSPYVIASMNNAVKEGYKTVVGYEANGGFLTGTDIINPDTGKPLKALPTRDAALPLIAALLSSVNTKKTVSEIIGELPPRYTGSGLIRGFSNETGRKIVNAFMEKSRELTVKYFKSAFGSAETVDFTDGARITFSNSDVVHLRPSGNAPEFRCYTESSVESRAEKNNAAAISIVSNTIRPDFE